MTATVLAQTSARTEAFPRAFWVVAAAGGAAALSWEVIWQLKTALAVGVSAQGTALTLAATMGGMTIGSALAGRWLDRHPVTRPVRVYGLLELVIGVSGLCLAPAFAVLESLDARIFRLAPSAAPLLQLIGMVVILGPPTLAMGATVPLFGLIARRYHTSIALLYGLNTLGAAVGVLLIAFLLMPVLGVWHSCLAIAAVNAGIAVATWSLPDAGPEVNKTGNAETPVDGPPDPLAPAASMALVFVTGFATFALEVAWFRAMRAAFLSMSYTFAILLAAVLVPLAAAARRVDRDGPATIRLGRALGAAGALVLALTPVVERFDVISRHYAFLVLPSWFLESLLVLGPPIYFAGLVFPAVLARQRTPESWGRLYAVNTFGAILGALLSGWLFLPALGFARSAWLVGGILVLTGLAAAPGSDRRRTLAWAGLGLVVAVAAESGVGRTRVIGAGPSGDYEVTASRETPDSTVSVIKRNDARMLYIDGFAASDESEAADYMAWMGRLPMVLHPDPKDALVICFGTGQTANAVRRQGPDRLDLVDLSRAVFELAPKFPTNEDVLSDPRVRAVTMDGRAWLRRTDRAYDVITLEPMPPTFAGVNALYDREFYRLALARLKPGGVLAQWLPFHLVTTDQGASIAATFRESFPNAVLWVDPLDATGILLGRHGDGPPLGSDWPGLRRPGGRLTPDQTAELRGGLLLNTAEVDAYAAAGRVITDDNQLLAYSWSFEPGLTEPTRLSAENHDRINRIRAIGPGTK